MTAYQINGQQGEFFAGEPLSRSLEDRVQGASLIDWIPLIGLGRTIEFAKQVGKHKHKPTLPETLYYGTNILYHTPALGVVALISIFFELYSAYETVKLRLESKGIPPFP